MLSNHTPLDKNKLIEDYEQSLIKLALTSYAELDGKKLMQENEKLKVDSFYQPTEEAKRKFNKTINKYYHKQKMKEVFSISYKYLNKIAVFLIIVTVLLSVSIFTVEGVRIKVLNLIMNIQNGYTEIRLDNDKENKNIIGNNLYINWDNAYAPTYIPNGYSIRNLTNNKNLKAIEYANKNGETILFQQLDEKGSANIDTEDADKVEKIVIQGCDGLLVNKDGLITVIWNAESFILNTPTDNLQNEDVVKIAESVSLIK
jgi:hypothetical protein